MQVTSDHPLRFQGKLFKVDMALERKVARAIAEKDILTMKEIRQRLFYMDLDPQQKRKLRNLLNAAIPVQV